MIVIQKVANRIITPFKQKRGRHIFDTFSESHLLSHLSTPFKVKIEFTYDTTSLKLIYYIVTNSKWVDVFIKFSSICKANILKTEIMCIL